MNKLITLIVFLFSSITCIFSQNIELEDSGTSSVDNVEVISPYKVYGTTSSIVIKDVKSSDISIYNISGELIWHNPVASDCQIEVTPGVYIVRSTSENFVTKVIVR